MREILLMFSSTLQQYYHQSTRRQRLDFGRVPSRDGPCWLCGGGQGGQAAGGDDGDDGGDQGCIFRLTCSHPELTEDHVLTSAYVKIFRTVTRNAVNKSV